MAFQPGDLATGPLSLGKFMSEPLSQSAIVREFARRAALRITRQAIAVLQGQPADLSGDRGLKSVWDELCVQVQDDFSIYWDEYQEHLELLVFSYVTDLPTHERNAIWLQTQAGDDWDSEDAEDRDPFPVDNDDVVNFLIHDFLLAQAGEWTNVRIRTYLEEGLGG